MAVQTSYDNDPAIGYAGQIRNVPPGGMITMVNAEASAVVPFGRAVAFKPSGTNDQDATLPANADDVVAGIVAKSQSYGIYPYGDLDQTNGGIVVGGVLNVVSVGEILVVCEDGCNPGDRLWVRRTAGGDPEFLGGLNSADDSTDTIDCTSQGQWMTTAAAGGLAWLRVNFVAKQTNAA
jgi:hypothetical protein